MREKPFTRVTIIAAMDQLASRWTRATFDQDLLRLDLDKQIALGDARGVPAKWPFLAQEILNDPTREIATEDGPATIAEAVVRMAVATMSESAINPEKDRLLRALALDGYVVSYDSDNLERPMLRASLPSELELPVIDDEVHQLLAFFGFKTAAEHLDQAIDAHTRGDWAAANAQIRTFLESLVDSAAFRLHPQRAAELATFDNRRALLGKEGFFSVDRNEWTPKSDGFVNGLFKMLHTEGSHPGLSDEEHSTFRLHLALVTGRTLLRRLKLGN